MYNNRDPTHSCATLTRIPSFSFRLSAANPSVYLRVFRLFIFRYFFPQCPLRFLRLKIDRRGHRGNDRNRSVGGRRIPVFVLYNRRPSHTGCSLFSFLRSHRNVTSRQSGLCKERRRGIQYKSNYEFFIFLFRWLLKLTSFG